MSLLERFQTRVRRLRDETVALSLAACHPDTPWYAKLFIAAIVAYAVSPIDLIPDFIPVLGYLDDLILIPLGIVVTIRMIPRHVMAESREASRGVKVGGGFNGRIVAIMIVGMWLVVAAFSAHWGI
jgi:uncharacterized membrane protein YkvA (DUF1232 family)